MSFTNISIAYLSLRSEIEGYYTGAILEFLPDTT